MGCKQNRNTANYCGRKQLPTLRTPLGQIRDAEQSAAERVLTAWSTTPPGAPERATRAERGFPAANKDSPTTWILQYMAPSRGSCREAEGVALGRRIFPRCTSSGQTYDAPRRTCSLRGALPLWGRRSEPRERRGASHRPRAAPSPSTKTCNKESPRKAVIP